MSAVTDAPTGLQLRCWQCKRLLAEVITAPWRVVCPRCKAANVKGLPPAPRSR